MQLSKHEFSKLSKADKQKLLSAKQTKSKTLDQRRKGNHSKLTKGLGSSTRAAPMSKAPISQGRTIKTARPKIVSLRNGDSVITHREYVGEVQAASGTPTIFSAASYPINPGQAAVFPWLSKIAANFESYIFQRLKFAYETEAPSTLGGTLVLAVDYDALDAVPVTKQQALAYRGSVRSPPWNDCCHTSVGEDLHKLKSRYVRTGAIPANSDLKTYDVGNLFTITQGVTTASAVCGELYVEYTVHLMTPVYDYSPSSAFLSGTAGTAASLITAGQVLQGSSVSGLAGNVISLQNLVVGGEYVLSVGAVTLAAGDIVFSAPVGLTLKSTMAGSNDTIQTYTATAQVGSITATAGGNSTNVLFSINSINTITF